MSATDLKLAILCHSPDHPAGSEKTVQMLARRLPNYGVDVRVLVPNRSAFSDALHADGVTVDVIGGGQRPTPKAICGLRNSLRKRPADVLQLHLSRFFVPVLPRGVGVVERLNMTRYSAGVYPMRQRWLDRFTARWIDHFVVVSESLRRQFLARGYPAETMQTVYNGVELPAGPPVSTLRDELGIAENVPLVGALGRLVEQKGIDVFLDAAAHIRVNLPEARFVIVGEGALRGALEARAGQLGLGDAVSFLGYRTDTSNVLAGFDVLVYPSRWEPLANTILESFAVGTPVVASNVGGNAELVVDGDCGCLFPHADPEAAAQAVTAFLRTPQRREAVTQAARRRAALFSVEAMVSAHADLYRLVRQEVGARR